MRTLSLAVVFLTGCVDLATICPYTPITQGVFGEILDANNTLEENVDVDAYSILNGMQDMKIATHATTRGGYQFNLLGPSTYQICAKTVCAMVTVPAAGLVELSAVDATAGLTWDPQAAVPPAQTIGPCKYGN